MSDYGDANREYEDEQHQRAVDVDTEPAIYATERVGEIETVGVDAALAQLGDSADRPVRPDGGGQTELDEWGGDA